MVILCNPLPLNCLLSLGCCQVIWKIQKIRNKYILISHKHKLILLPYRHIFIKNKLYEKEYLTNVTV